MSQRKFWNRVSLGKETAKSLIIAVEFYNRKLFGICDPLFSLSQKVLSKVKLTND